MRTFLRTRGATVVGAFAAFGLLAVPALGQDCGAGNVAELEACGDDENGGCNAVPAAFQDIACGDSVNGTAWAFDDGTGGSRDTDWYRIALPDPDGDGQATLRASLLSEFPGVVFIINNIDDCVDTAIVANGFSDANCAGGTPATICLPAPANYTVFVSVGNPDGSAIFEGYSCDDGDNDYLVSVECIQAGENGSECTVIDPLCIGAEGGCGEANGSPGCDDPVCCSEVCAFDAFCCETEWDETCVEAAVALCGIFVYDCSNPGPANDCCSDPMLVAVNDVVAFDTTGANTDGPDQPECGSGSGDEPIWSDVWYMIEAPGDGRLIATTCGTADFDTKIAAYDAGDGTFECTELINAFIACNEDCNPDATSELSIDVTEGNFYLIRLGGFQEQTGTGTIWFRFKQVLWDTGPNRALIFNGAATNLGWSSGNLSATFPQRWNTQAFTLGDPPNGADSWEICQLNVNGFVPAGAVNETIDYIIWCRNGTARAEDGDQLVTGSVPFPAAVDDPEGAPGNGWQHPMEVNFFLAPGDYWLTVYGANTTGEASNFAWFANPDFGINVLDGDGNPFMWRSAFFPAPGFEMYTTPAVEQAEGLDPNDVYNASFEVLGTPSSDAGNSCDDEPVCDCPDFDGDNMVGASDLATLLADWNTAGSNPNGGPCNTDLDGSGNVDAADLATLLAAWGPCP